MPRTFDRRVIEPELMDTLSAEQAAPNLVDLVRLKRDWGGRSTITRLLDQNIPRDEPFTLLDVGAASGDMGEWIRRCRPLATVVSLDYKIAHQETDDPERTMRELRSLFAPQVQAYAKVLRNLRGEDVVIRAGLYYPRMLLFDWWEA